MHANHGISIYSYTVYWYVSHNGVLSMKADRMQIESMCKDRPAVYEYTNRETMIVSMFLMETGIHISSYETGGEFLYCLEKWISENRAYIKETMGW